MRHASLLQWLMVLLLLLLLVLLHQMHLLLLEMRLLLLLQRGRSELLPASRAGSRGHHLLHLQCLRIGLLMLRELLSERQD